MVKENPVFLRPCNIVWLCKLGVLIITWILRAGERKERQEKEEVPREDKRRLDYPGITDNQILGF